MLVEHSEFDFCLNNKNDDSLQTTVTILAYCYSLDGCPGVIHFLQETLKSLFMYKTVLFLSFYNIIE